MLPGSRGPIETVPVNGEDGLVLLRDTAERQALSQRYLRHMMTQSRNSGLVVVERCARGGYRLSRPASVIRPDEIVEADLKNRRKEMRYPARKGHCDNAAD